MEGRLLLGLHHCENSGHVYYRQLEQDDLRW